MQAKPIILLVFLGCLAVLSVAQQVPSETKQFDFWIGNWDAAGKMATGPDTWQDTKATNKIERIMNGHTVHEQFKGAGMSGSSWSVYDARHKAWRQTWVDDQGGYIDLSGKFEDGKMVLQTVPDPDRPKAFNRMTFLNITAKEFDWNWEGSKDGGKTWTLQWHLHYTRK